MIAFNEEKLTNNGDQISVSGQMVALNEATKPLTLDWPPSTDLLSSNTTNQVGSKMDVNVKPALEIVQDKNQQFQLKLSDDGKLKIDLISISALDEAKQEIDIRESKPIITICYDANKG